MGNLWYHFMYGNSNGTENRVTLRHKQKPRKKIFSQPPHYYKKFATNHKIGVIEAKKNTDTALIFELKIQSKGSQFIFNKVSTVLYQPTERF
jgi:hypothetical protein